MKKKSHMQVNLHFFYTRFADCWVLTNQSDKTSLCPADLLASYGFQIPESVTYCLAQVGNVSLKYRAMGNAIFIHISLL